MDLNTILNLALELGAISAVISIFLLGHCLLFYNVGFSVQLYALMQFFTNYATTLRNRKLDNQQAVVQAKGAPRTDDYGSTKASGADMHFARTSLHSARNR